jgi:hypothetical protein
LACVVLIVAAVPNDRCAMCGSSAAQPSTSHALSAAAAISGRPAGRPRAVPAAAVSVPSVAPGGTRRGSWALRIASAFQCHSPARAHCCRL